MKRKPTFNHTDVKILSQSSAYQGFLHINRYQLKHRLFEGGWSDVISRELNERSDAAGALLYDPVLEKIVMIEQFRIGAKDLPQGPWMLEIIAGLLKPDEDPAALIHRETMEEAGCEILALEHICSYQISPGTNNGRFSLFCARVDASNAGGVFGLADEHEDIRVEVISIAHAFELLEQGELENAPAIIALQWLSQHQKQLHEKWLSQPK